MPFKSQAQRRFFHAAASRGEIPTATVAKWEEHTPEGKLPERVKKTEGSLPMKDAALWQGFIEEQEAIEKAAVDPASAALSIAALGVAGKAVRVFGTRMPVARWVAKEVFAAGVRSGLKGAPAANQTMQMMASLSPGVGDPGLVNLYRVGRFVGEKARGTPNALVTAQQLLREHASSMPSSFQPIAGMLAEAPINPTPGSFRERFFDVGSLSVSEAIRKLLGRAKPPVTAPTASSVGATASRAGDGLRSLLPEAAMITGGSLGVGYLLGRRPEALAYRRQNESTQDGQNE